MDQPQLLWLGHHYDPARDTEVDDVGETMQLLDDFENYGTSDSVPTTWFNYGNAGGGVSVVGVADSRARSGQLGDNKLLAWGFDAVSDPGYGGVGKSTHHLRTGLNTLASNFGFTDQGKAAAFRLK